MLRKLKQQMQYQQPGWKARSTWILAGVNHCSQWQRVSERGYDTNVSGYKSIKTGSVTSPCCSGSSGAGHLQRRGTAHPLLILDMEADPLFQQNMGTDNTFSRLGYVFPFIRSVILSLSELLVPCGWWAGDTCRQAPLSTQQPKLTEAYLRSRCWRRSLAHDRDLSSWSGMASTSLQISSMTP